MTAPKSNASSQTGWFSKTTLTQKNSNLSKSPASVAPPFVIGPLLEELKEQEVLMSFCSKDKGDDKVSLDLGSEGQDGFSTTLTLLLMFSTLRLRSSSLFATVEADFMASFASFFACSHSCFSL